MNVAVIGSRTFDNFALVESTLASISTISRVVSGGAKGADSLAQRYAEQNQIPVEIFKPDWKRFGRGAGIVRNREIIEAAEMVVAFWDGKSKGTESSIKMAQSKRIPVKIVKF